MVHKEVEAVVDHNFGMEPQRVPGAWLHSGAACLLQLVQEVEQG
jgi:hypothetical protein